MPTAKYAKVPVFSNLSIDASDLVQFSSAEQFNVYERFVKEVVLLSCSITKMEVLDVWLESKQ